SRARSRRERRHRFRGPLRRSPRRTPAGRVGCLHPPPKGPQPRPPPLRRRPLRAVSTPGPSRRRRLHGPPGGIIPPRPREEVRMFHFGPAWWALVGRTTVVYAAILIGFRLLGKRELGQFTAFDLVLVLLIANAVQNAMVGPDFSLSGGLVAAA